MPQVEKCDINKYTEDAPHRDAEFEKMLVKLTQCLFDLILIFRALSL